MSTTEIFSFSRGWLDKVGTGQRVLRYIRDIFLKNKVFGYSDNSLYDKKIESYQSYETIMNLSQLKDSITFIKELLETNSVEEILQKLDNSFSLNIEFSINQDFGIDLTNSDEEWYIVKPFVQSPL